MRWVKFVVMREIEKYVRVLATRPQRKNRMGYIGIDGIIVLTTSSGNN
jgi:hypothetical protein